MTEVILGGENGLILHAYQLLWAQAPWSGLRAWAQLSPTAALSVVP